MSDYTKTTNFTAKDALPSGDPNKKILGSLFDTEFDAIQTANNTKANKLTSVTSTNNLFKTDANGDLVEATSISDNGSEVTILAGRTFNVADNSGLKIAGTAITSTAAELNLLDGASAGSIVNSKSVIYGAAGEVNASELQVSGTAITATPAELNKLDGVTASTAELNLVDGVTATTAELNELDASAAAVSGFDSGVRTYITSVPTTAAGFDISGNITSGTWETIGPTGSGATNIFTDMDNAPSDRTAYICRIKTGVNGSSSGTSYDTTVHAIKNGETETASAGNRVAWSQNTNRSGLSELKEDICDVIIPCDSNGVIDVYYSTDGSSGNAELILVGFLA